MVAMLEVEWKLKWKLCLNKYKYKLSWRAISKLILPLKSKYRVCVPTSYKYKLN